MTSLQTEFQAIPLSQLESRARAANTVAELGFSIANDVYGLIGFRQALVFAGEDERGRLLTVSGLARPTEDSPYLVWLKRCWPWLCRQLKLQPGWFEMPSGPQGLPDGIFEGWCEWWPAGVYALPLRTRVGRNLGWVCFLLDTPPTGEVTQAISQLSETWSYCWEMLSGNVKTPWYGIAHKFTTQRKVVIGATLLALLLFPIRQSALAPAEIIALDSSVVASPLDGVVKTIHVRPNQPVKAGQMLFSLEDTTLKSRLDVARKSIAVADAELLSTTQKAFDAPQSKGDIAVLSGRAQERRAELLAVQAQLARIDVLATRDGVAVFGDPADWLGRPVSTGERIMLLADPALPGILIHLPVADAIALDIGAPVKLFLSVLPLSPLDGHVSETSYQSVLSPEGIASYRLRAGIDAGQEHARIGLRGTAKVYGGWGTLGYYLLRRPLATLREWTGL